MPAGQSLGTADAAAVRTEARQREMNNERTNEITAFRGWMSTHSSMETVSVKSYFSLIDQTVLHGRGQTLLALFYHGKQR